uniref:LEC14B homolog n=1 Tax=Erigeron canadensis TaxID=72917 RepID=UPI001CB98DEE|nr:LEC14B homolog [Erigeron canadensis]
MSRSRKSVNRCRPDSEIGGRAPSADEGLSDIAVATKLSSKPHRFLGRMLPGKSEGVPIISPVKMLAGREGNYSGRSRFTTSDRCHLSSRYLPVNGPSLIDRMSSCAYVSQFSADGTLFVAGFQDSDIKIYNVDSGWKVKKNIRARSLRWTITDTSLSPDQRFLVYSSMSPMVHIVDIGSTMTDSVANVTEIHEGLDFSDDDDYSFGIFSVKFSTDGREVVAASSDDAIYVYDLAANKLNVRIPAHTSDVNSVCFADEAGHVLYSGSDDHLVKVWDRRCLGSRESGVLTGHLEGITFIDSHGDGHYLISNGKDQTIKLWDIRKMSSNFRLNSLPTHVEWDYRWMEYPSHLRNRRHPNDQSLMTYRGHRVLRTLIRCYFSPSYSTGQKYIYTGSADGQIYIYDLVTGAKVARLRYHDQIVRDCSWHPFNPMLGSSSWDGAIANWELSPLPEKRN